MSNKPTVIVDPHFRRMAEIFSSADRVRLKETVEVVWGKDEPMPVDDFAAVLPKAEAVVSADWRYGNDLLKKAKNLRAVLDVSGGFPSSIDYDYCFANRIRVLSTAPAFGRQVAEMALGMALAASRDICAGDFAFRNGSEKWLHAGNVGTFMLFDKPVGLIGFGGLARALRPLLAPFGCPIAVYDPWLGEGYLRSQGVTPLSLDRLIETSRVIFVLAAPRVDNRAFLSRDVLEKIQPGAVLVLISRAHVVDFDALTELVVAGRFKAAIDVFPSEPFPLDHPIRRAPGAVLSAHRAGSVEEGLWELGQMVVDDLEAITRHLPPQRLLVAQPETVGRYATIKVPGK
jgi:phosphoglycerate dehydrogenase-like enzyme